MTPSGDDARGIYLPSGLRLGRGAERLFARVSLPPPEFLGRGREADALFALSCELRSGATGRPVMPELLEALTDEIRLTLSDCPDLLPDVEQSRPPSKFGGLRVQWWTGAEGYRVGEITWRSVHPWVAGAPITTTVVVEQKRHHVELSVQVTADGGHTSVRGYVGAGHAQPVFLSALRERVSFVWMGARVEPRAIPLGAVDRWIGSVVAPPEREVPVAVLAPMEDGTYVVDPAVLAHELLGRATLHLIQTPAQSFDLTSAVGDRRMSCFLGALRCYFPGWSRHDEPMDHPLLLGDRVSDPVQRAVWMGEVGLWMARRVGLPPSIDERLERARVEKEEAEGVAGGVAARATGGPTDAAGATAEAHQSREGGPARETAMAPADAGREGTGAGSLPSPTGSPTDATSISMPAVPDAALPLLEGLVEEVQALAGLVEQLLKANEELTDEVQRLRTLSAVRSSSTQAIERRMGRLEELLARTLRQREELGQGILQSVAPDPLLEVESDQEADEEGRLSLEEVVRTAAEVHSDALLFLDPAFRSAADSPYEDPERVRAVLDAMARIARIRRNGSLGTALRDAFGDLGIDYRTTIARSTPARLRQQYQFTGPAGQTIEAVEHIVLGGTYDPRRCLRIYFSSREPQEPRFIIGHVGRHFEVVTST